MLGAHLWGMCWTHIVGKGPPRPILQPFDHNRRSHLKKLNPGFGVFVGVDYENVSKLLQFVDPKFTFGVNNIVNVDSVVFTLELDKDIQTFSRHHFFGFRKPQNL